MENMNLVTTERKRNTNNRKYLMITICLLHTMQLQKEVKSNPQQPSYKKVCGPRKAIVKKEVKSKVVAKKWL